MAGNFASTPVVYNVTLTDADTEYELVLPDGTTYFEFQARQNVDIRYQWQPGYVATPTAPYLTLKRGYTYDSYNMWGSQTISLFLASSTAGTVVEVNAWR